MSSPDQSDISRFISTKTTFKLPLGHDVLEFAKVGKNDLEKIMNDLGKYLSVIHRIEGRGFGLISSDDLVKNQKLKGSHDSWYEFLEENFLKRFNKMKKVVRKEKISRKRVVKLSQENRELLNICFDRASDVLKILKMNKELINSSPSKLLNGNIHLGSIAVKNNKFVGLSDYTQTLLGDPVNDLAYFSVMPGGAKLTPFVIRGWSAKTSDTNFDKKMHLYRLLESYRKIFKRYYKYKYLNDYPEPLKIAQTELAHYNIK